MRKKIILACVLALATVSSGCGFWDWLKALFTGGCGITFCCHTGLANTRFDAIFFDGTVEHGTIGGCGQITCEGHYRIHPNHECAISFVDGSNFGFPLTASLTAVDLNSPPPSITISGQGFDATYGTPAVEYYDGSGFFLGSATATSVAADGTWLTAPVPDLSQAYSGAFQLQVTNKNSYGSYLDIVGTATLSCYGRDRPDSDGDGWYDDEDCYPYDSSLWSCSDPGDGGGGGTCDPYCMMY
jgi:hypothetical protein